jgi:hypothetical protein
MGNVVPFFEENVAPVRYRDFTDNGAGFKEGKSVFIVDFQGCDGEGRHIGIRA